MLVHIRSVKKKRGKIIVGKTKAFVCGAFKINMSIRAAGNNLKCKYRNEIAMDPLIQSFKV